MAFLRDLRRVLEEEQDLTPERVCKILAERWGGERPYIARRVERQQIDPLDTPKTVARKHGVSRSTAYNWVKMWR